MDDEPETHKLECYQEGNVITLNCETCGYKVAFVPVFGKVTLNSGKPGVRHEYSAQMTVGAVLTAPQPSPFEEWIENEADFDAPLIED